MRHEFVNEQPVRIDPGPANTIQSVINVNEPEDAMVQDIEVRLDIDHTWTGDLVIKLQSPDGTDVTLVERQGGSKDDFRNTIFRADAETSITEGRPPYRGNFRAQGDLSKFNGKSAKGSWTLVIEDKATQDGGSLNRWALSLNTSLAAPTAFAIDVRFLGGLSPTQQAAFASAATRWAQVIKGDLPSVIIDGQEIDDILIDAQGINIDGPGGVLGQAGPSHIRPGSMLPAKGIMSFDTADLERMENDGSLTDVILHEMSHVLGFGTVWSRMNLIAGSGTINPTFIGAKAMLEYAKLTNRAEPSPAPIANTGGPGTREGHWRESVLGDELLTGFISGNIRPLSALSIAAFEDMGYEVDYTAADAFELPNALMLAELGVTGDRTAIDSCSIEHIEPIVLPPSAIINN